MGGKNIVGFRGGTMSMCCDLKVGGQKLGAETFGRFIFWSLKFCCVVPFTVQYPHA